MAAARYSKGRAKPPGLTKADISSSPRRPNALSIKPDAIPAELRERRQWVCWKYQQRDGKWAKIPIDPNTGRMASTTNPQTWGSFQEALAYQERNKLDGIGFVFTADDPFAGVDLDDCRNPETGDIESWARKIVADFKSYAEVSPSGTGVKVFLRGKVPPGGNRKGKVEVYDRLRYFAVTGHHLDDTPVRTKGRAKTLKAFHADLFGPSKNNLQTTTPSANGIPCELEDQQVIRRAKRAKNGSTFQQLWGGDTSGYKSRSEADQALCAVLAFWVGRDPERIDRLFRQCKLYRPKWDREGYRRSTIAKALETQTEFYSPEGNRTKERGRGSVSGGYQFAPKTPAELAAAVRQPTWLVERLLVAGQPAILGGPKKVLKTSLAVDLAVSLATGTEFLGKFGVPNRVRVTLLSGESGDWAVSDTIRRVCAARKRKPERHNRLLVDFRLPQLGIQEDLDQLADGIREHAVEVVIIDPLYLALLSGTNLQASNLYDVGPHLANVTQACLEAGATPLYVHHTRKALAVGSPAELEDLAFAGVAEFARQWLLINRRQKFDPETGTHQLWLSAGGSCGQAGLWAVDVVEGHLNEDFTGRVWKVTVHSPGEQRERDQDEKDATRKTKKETQEAADEQALLSTLDQMDPNKEGVGCNRLHDRIDLSRGRMNNAITRLVAQEVLENCQVPVEIGCGGTRMANGIRRIG